MPVILATGGIGAIFGKSTNSVVCTGSAQSAVFQQGAYYANGEFIQVHPTSIPGEDKLRLMSESARGEGGRVWVPRKAGDNRPFKQIPESERLYFLEEWYPKYGNLVPRDVATRAIHKVVYELGLGLDGQPMVYLDLTHIDRETLNRKLEGILEIYEKFVGDDPREVPMKIFPGMHYTMGGLWVDFNQMTNIPGLFAAGEASISTTAPIASAQTRSSAASSADLFPAPSPSNTPKISPRPKATAATQPNSPARPKSTRNFSATRAPRIPSSYGASWDRP